MLLVQLLWLELQLAPTFSLAFRRSETFLPWRSQTQNTFPCTAVSCNVHMSLRAGSPVEDKRSLRELAGENESCRNSTYLNLRRHLLDLLRVLGMLLPRELTLRRQYSGRIRNHRLLLSRADHNLCRIILLPQKKENRPVACVPRHSA